MAVAYMALDRGGGAGFWNPSSPAGVQGQLASLFPETPWESAVEGGLVLFFPHCCLELGFFRESSLLVSNLLPAHSFSRPSGASVNEHLNQGLTDVTLDAVAECAGTQAPTCTVVGRLGQTAQLLSPLLRPCPLCL